MKRTEALVLYRAHTHAQRPTSSLAKAMRKLRRGLGLEAKDRRLVHLKAYLQSNPTADADIDYDSYICFIIANFSDDYALYNSHALADPKLPCPEIFEAIFATAPAERRAKIEAYRPVVLSPFAPKFHAAATANLDSFPSILDPRMGATPETVLTMGDLHANAIKFLYILIREKVITELDEVDYAELSAFYKKDVSGLTSGDIRRFKEILDKAKAPVKSVLVRLIGDVLCDRGNQDAFTLFILNRLKELDLKVEVIASNHDGEFIRAYTPVVTDSSFEFAETIFVKGKEQDSSLSNMQTLLTRMPELKPEIAKIIETSYLPEVKLLSYELSADNKAINIYTHAPVGLETLHALANYFLVDFKASTAAELATTIDAINTEVQECGGVKAILDVMPKANIMRNPVHRLMWNRDYRDLHRPALLSESRDSLCFVHGHDHDHTIKFPSSPHIMNLDDQLGKMTVSTNNHRGAYQVLYSEPTKEVRLEEVRSCASSEEEPSSLLYPPGYRTPPRFKMNLLAGVPVPAPAFDLSNSGSPASGAGYPLLPATPPRTPSPSF